MRFGLNCTQATVNLAHVRIETCVVTQQCSEMFNPPAKQLKLSSNFTELVSDIIGLGFISLGDK